MALCPLHTLYFLGQHFETRLWDDHLVTQDSANEIALCLHEAEFGRKTRLPATLTVFAKLNVMDMTGFVPEAS